MQILEKYHKRFTKIDVHVFVVTLLKLIKICIKEKKFRTITINNI